MKSEFIQKIYTDILSNYKNDIILFFLSMVILEILTILTFSHIVSYFIKDISKKFDYNKIIWLFVSLLTFTFAHVENEHRIKRNTNFLITFPEFLSLYLQEYHEEKISKANDVDSLSTHS